MALDMHNQIAFQKGIFKKAETVYVTITYKNSHFITLLSQFCMFLNLYIW